MGPAGTMAKQKRSGFSGYYVAAPLQSQRKWPPRVRLLVAIALAVGLWAVISGIIFGLLEAQVMEAPAAFSKTRLIIA